MSVNYVLEGILQMEVDARNVPNLQNVLPANLTISTSVRLVTMDIILMEESVRLALILTAPNVPMELMYVLNIEPQLNKLLLNQAMEL